MAELKPCPFCGGAAQIYNPFHMMGRPGQAATYRGGVRCSECGCESKASTPPDEAIVAWNRRECAMPSNKGAERLRTLFEFVVQLQGLYGDNVAWDSGWRAACKRVLDQIDEMVRTEPAASAGPWDCVIPKLLLTELIDDVQDYAASRTFKDREKAWRDDVLTRARAALAARSSSPVDSVPTFDEIADVLPNLPASSQCPLCGRDYLHEHSPEEIIIYRNGVKWGARNGGLSWKDHQGAPQDARADTTAIGGSRKAYEDEHLQYRVGQADPDGNDAKRNSGSARIQGDGQVRMPSIADESAPVEAGAGVTLDRRDLFDFVRGGIKLALEAVDAGKEMTAGWYWEEATQRTERVLGNLGVFAAPQAQAGTAKAEYDRGWDDGHIAGREKAAGGQKLTTAEKIAIQRAIDRLSSDPVSVSVLETLLRASDSATASGKEGA